MNQYEIIVLDLDGTLTNRDKVNTPKTQAALLELQRRGKKIVLASGRPTQGVMPLAKELELDQYGSYILSYNGGDDYGLLQRGGDFLTPDSSGGKTENCGAGRG